MGYVVIPILGVCVSPISSFSNCRITEAGAATIAKGLEVNGQLQELIMDNNAFADAGAILIVKAATQCETLTKLSMKVGPTSAALHGSGSLMYLNHPPTGH